MTSSEIIESLAQHVPGAGLQEVNTGDGMPTIGVPREQLVDTCRALRDHLGFAFLADLVPIDFHPREPRYEISYLLVSLGVAGFGERPMRLRVKVRVPGADAVVPTVSGVWASANWSEREAYDFFGISFADHPDLRRILMPEDWEGFPLRKDYPVQIKQPVKTYEPLQVSEEQFVANIEAARERARRD